MNGEKLQRVLEGDEIVHETGAHYERAVEGARALKYALQNPPPGVAPFQAPSGFAGELKAFFLAMIEDPFLIENAMIICFTMADGRTMMGIGLRSDIDFWISPGVAEHFQVREPIRVYGLLKYATEFLGVTKSGKN